MKVFQIRPSPERIDLDQLDRGQNPDRSRRAEEQQQDPQQHPHEPMGQPVVTHSGQRLRMASSVIATEAGFLHSPAAGGGRVAE